MWKETNYPLQAIYLHLPFCQHRCAYCDFYSTTWFSPELIDRYVFYMIRLLREKARYFGKEKIESIFFGGGTPSLLSERQVAAILDTIHCDYRLAKDVEISLEVNPATITPAKALGYRMSGINRISLGAQSFHSGELKTLGRFHTPEQIEQTVELIHRAGLHHLSLDLIYGIPGQSILSWQHSLERAVKCAVEHLSLYLLQLEAGVPLALRLTEGTLQAMDEETEACLYELALDYLPHQGFTQYEISNFSRPGKECRHNLAYWQAAPYLGIGAGAVSFIGNSRFMLHPALEQFFAKDSQSEILETMNPQELANDALILGLRLNRGVDVQQLARRFALPEIKTWKTKFALLAEQGLVTINWPQVALSRKGLFLSNLVFRELL